MELVLIKQGCMLQDVQVGDQPKISGGPARGEKRWKNVVHTAKRLPYEVGKRCPGEAATGGLSPVRQWVIATLKMLALLLVYDIYK